MIKEYIINRDNKIALQPACSDVCDILGEGLSRREEEVQAFHFNLGIPNTSMEGGKSDLGLVFQLTPHIVKGGKLGLEFLFKPTSPLYRERIECPATKGAEDILGEGLSRREEEVPCLA